MTKKTRLLAIDPGKVRLGLAVSDPDRKIASPLENYSRKSPSEDIRHLLQVIQDEDIAQIVVGLPLHMDGNEGEQAAAARQFGAWLKEVTGLEVIFWDERCSTAEAETALLSAGLTSGKRKARRDQVAATLILQSYLDAD
ncbi:MAG: Holliday junction resolvase RuvX [Gemmataceae bacterium]|nr:Holliday junction resolvase RuvX [Gemmataceae bacterium]